MARKQRIVINEKLANILDEDIKNSEVISSYAPREIKNDFSSAVAEFVEEEEKRAKAERQKRNFFSRLFKGKP